LNKIAALIVTLIAGGVLFYSTAFFPKWGDPKQPASIHVSPRYIEMTLAETKVPNAVTRSADFGVTTMFETSVIFTAASP
jgi:multicomponent Na+:H+ antiporter subunit B